MIEREKTAGVITVLCDECQDEITLENLEENSSDEEVNREIKPFGWTASKADGEWEHLCPGCSDRDMYL